jgi:hypothetical protein
MSFHRFSEQKSIPNLSPIFFEISLRFSLAFLVSLSAVNAANLLSFKKLLRLFLVGFCYSAQQPGVKTRCRADLIPARFARIGPAGLKNWSAKNLWEVLVKSGW